MDYKTAYNKIIDAYFKNQIKPLDNEFCFCGTLSIDKFWREEHKIYYTYTRNEYLNMEAALFEGINKIFNQDVKPNTSIFDAMEKWHKKSPLYEDALFNGMSAALDVLKDIHRNRGENVDDELIITKRLLNTKTTEPSTISND